MGRSLDNLLANAKLKTQLQRLVEDADLKAEAANMIIEEVGRFDELARRTLLEKFVYSPYIEKLTGILEEDVTTDLQLPGTVTLKDLTSAASRYLLLSPATFDDRHKEFCRFVSELANNRNKTMLIPVCCGRFFQPHQEEQSSLWADKAQNFKVVMLPPLAIDDEHGDVPNYDQLPFPVSSKRQIFVRIEGTSSPDAFQEFCDEIVCVLDTLFTGIAELHFMPYSVLDKIEDFLSVDELGKTVSPMIDAYYSKSTKKDSIDRRVRNAVHLLVQSNMQRHNSISLALSVAAIEAMLCQKGSDITNQIAEGSATLLEPDSKLRADAVSWIKELYAQRSDVLHGTKVENERGQVRDARLLAVAVLCAYLSRREFQRKMGVDDESPGKFFEELGKSKWVAGDIPGVSTSPIRMLWGGPTPKIEPNEE